MKANIYYQDVFARSGAIQKWAAALIYFLTSYPKLVLDVFLRRSMGERYFTLPSASITGLVLILLPNIYPDTRYVSVDSNGSPYTIYYVFFAAYAIMSVKRYIEISREPGIFDFKRFSLSQGYPYRFFYKIRPFKKTPSLRIIQLYYEPLLCILVALMFRLFDQYLLSSLLIFCTICYYISNSIATYQGDHFVMDTIDEILCNQDMSETFIKDQDISPSGIAFPGRKPTTEDLRRGFMDAINEEPDEVS